MLEVQVRCWASALFCSARSDWCSLSGGWPHFSSTLRNELLSSCQTVSVEGKLACWNCGLKCEGGRYVSGLSECFARAASLLRVGRWPLRPVLKHGPRRLTHMQVIGCKTQRHSESKGLFGKLRGDTSVATPAHSFSLV